MSQIRRFQYEVSDCKFEDFIILSDKTSDEEAFNKYGRNQNRNYRIYYGFMDWEKFNINKVKKED